METWLLLDCPYLCWRAHHSTGHLAYGAEPTGVIFGFLKALKSLQARFQTQKTVFVWDGPGPSKRVELYPQYKANRLKVGQKMADVDERANVRRQMAEIECGILPELGYKNIFTEEGYEADDVIASVVYHSLPEGDKAVIVSADHDFYQLLSPRVNVWHPGKGEGMLVSPESLKETYGVEPDQWAMVKALSGCKSDNVFGVPGIGERTACRYLSGRLSKKSKAYYKAGHADDIVKRNLPLVILPFPGCPRFKLGEDELSPRGLRGVCRRYGLDSLGV